MRFIALFSLLLMIQFDLYSQDSCWQITRHTTANGDPKGFNHLLQIGEQLLAGTDEGVFKYNNDFQLISAEPLAKHRSHYLIQTQKDIVWSIFLDRNKGTKLRIRNVLHEPSFQAQMQNIELREKQWLRDYKFIDQSILIATSKSVFRYFPHVNNLVKNYKIRFPEEVQFKFVKIGSVQGLWAASENYVFHYDGSQWRKFDQSNSPFKGRSKIGALQLSQSGRPYVVYGFSIYYYDSEEWVFLGKIPQEKSFCSDPYQMVFDQEGRLWVGRMINLWMYDDEKWQHIVPSGNTKLNGRIRSMQYFDDQLWIKTYHGLVCIRSLCN